MATIEEVLEVLSDILAEMATRPDGGTWGVPADYSVLVRQDQPPASGSSQFKVEDVQMPTNTYLARLAGDITTRTFAQVLSDIGAAASSHTHAAADIVSGTIADARIAQSNVTQHEAAINHDALASFVADEHVAHSGVTLTAGVGLAGGGTIAANRTFDLDINGLTADATPDGAADYVATYDADAATHKKVLLNNLPGGGGSSLPVVDTTSIVKGSVDATKQIRFEVDGLTTATTRVLTPLDKDYTIGDVTLTGSQTLEDKTLVNPLINTNLRLFGSAGKIYTIGWAVPAAGRALDIDDPGADVKFIFDTATQTLTNKTLTAPALTTPTVSDEIQHAGDSDTKMYFTTDSVVIQAGGRKIAQFVEAAIDQLLVNPDAVDVDFSVNSDNVSGLLKVDAALDHVGVNGVTTGLFGITGRADENQLYVKGNATQTNDIVLVEKSDGTDLLTIDNSGGVMIKGDLEIWGGQGAAEVTVSSGQMTFNNGTTDTGLAWGIDDGTLVIKIGSSSEVIIEVSEMGFGNNSGLAWSTTEQLDITCSSVVEVSVSADTMTFNNGTGLDWSSASDQLDLFNMSGTVLTIQHDSSVVVTGACEADQFRATSAPSGQSGRLTIGNSLVAAGKPESVTVGGRGSGPSGATSTHWLKVLDGTTTRWAALWT